MEHEWTTPSAIDAIFDYFNSKISLDVSDNQILK